MASVETMAVVNRECQTAMIINVEDFDPKKHQKVDDKGKPVPDEKVRVRPVKGGGDDEDKS